MLKGCKNLIYSKVFSFASCCEKFLLEFVLNKSFMSVNCLSWELLWAPYQLAWEEFQEFSIRKLPENQVEVVYECTVSESCPFDSGLLWCNLRNNFLWATTQTKRKENNLTSLVQTLFLYSKLKLNWIGQLWTFLEFPLFLLFLSLLQVCGGWKELLDAVLVRIFRERLWVDDFWH